MKKEQSVQYVSENQENYPVAAKLQCVVMDIKAKAGEWNTLCVPFDVSRDRIDYVFGAGTEVKEFTGVTKRPDGTVELNFTTVNEFKGGVPYLVKPTLDVDVPFSLPYRTVYSDAPKSVTHDGVTLTGVYAPTQLASDGKHFVAGEGGNVFAESDNENALKALHAYITLPEDVKGVCTPMDYVAYLSANNTTEADVDTRAYKKPVDLYLRRSFQQGWNPIVLPFDISMKNLEKNFGTGVKLCKLADMTEDKTAIRFERTDVLEAGECGLIYVPEAKPYYSDLSIALPLNVLGSTDKKQAYGPLYLIKGVKRNEEVTSTIVEKTYPTAGGSIDFTGYYYKPGQAWPGGSYIMEYGKMYHLDSDWGKIYGTMWCLTDKTQSGVADKFEIDGVTDDIVTAIDGVVMDDVVNSGDVYTVSGQRMNGEALPKGIYVKNGRKVVVK